MLVCNRCGWKASCDRTGRSVMKDHLAAKHQLGGTQEAAAPVPRT
jgi:hypothetical protein